MNRVFLSYKKSGDHIEIAFLKIYFHSFKINVL